MNLSPRELRIVKEWCGKNGDDLFKSIITDDVFIQKILADHEILEAIERDKWEHISFALKDGNARKKAIGWCAWNCSRECSNHKEKAYGCEHNPIEVIPQRIKAKINIPGIL